MKIVLVVIFYLLIRRIWKKIKTRFEKLEGIEGEFIYTYLKGFFKKEVYFSLHEVEIVYFSRVFINNSGFKNILLNIILKDGYIVVLKKKENCIHFLKSCKENDRELYMKIIQKFPMGLDISSIIENEIENYKNKDKKKKK